MRQHTPPGKHTPCNYQGPASFLECETCALDLTAIPTIHLTVEECPICGTRVRETFVHPIELHPLR